MAEENLKNQFDITARRGRWEAFSARRSHSPGLAGRVKDWTEWRLLKDPMAIIPFKFCPGGTLENSQGQARSAQVLLCRSRAVPGNIEPQVVASRQGRWRHSLLGKGAVASRALAGAPLFSPWNPGTARADHNVTVLAALNLNRPACPWLFSVVPPGLLILK